MPIDAKWRTRRKVAHEHVIKDSKDIGLILIVRAWPSVHFSVGFKAGF